MNNLIEFSTKFGQFVQLYKNYLKLVFDSEQAFLVDLLKPSKEHYPSDVTYTPRIRKAAKQFNECVPRVRYLLKVVLKQFPKEDVLRGVRRVTKQINVPEKTDFIVRTEERENELECDYRLNQMQQFLWAASQTIEKSSLLKGSFKIRKTDFFRPQQVILLSPKSSTVPVTKRLLQQPSVKFLILMLYTVMLYNRCLLLSLLYYSHIACL